MEKDPSQRATQRPGFKPGISAPQRQQQPNAAPPLNQECSTKAFFVHSYMRCWTDALRKGPQKQYERNRTPCLTPQKQKVRGGGEIGPLDRSQEFVCTAQTCSRSKKLGNGPCIGQDLNLDAPVPSGQLLLRCLITTCHVLLYLTSFTRVSHCVAIT